MDLNWCVICDQHVDEAVSFNQHPSSILTATNPYLQLDSSLYCSDSCRVKDQKNENTVNLSTSPSTSLHLNTANRMMKTPFLISRLAKKPVAAALSTTSYPWVPLYRKRHGIAVARRCVPAPVSTLVTKPFAPMVV
ncbi:hypothetical protein BC943DRAFT_318151 [Umbelopsis sp. AD052]|nr:hypothetical protein BC943DRAFT_318151 [Umbelopsis sp. AD052]